MSAEITLNLRHSSILADHNIHSRCSIWQRQRRGSDRGVDKDEDEDDGEQEDKEETDVERWRDKEVTKLDRVTLSVVKTVFVTWSVIVTSVRAGGRWANKWKDEKCEENKYRATSEERLPVSSRKAEAEAPGRASFLSEYHHTIAPNRKIANTSSYVWILPQHS